MLLLLILIFIVGFGSGYITARSTKQISGYRNQKELSKHRDKLIGHIKTADMLGDTSTVEILRKALEKSYDE